MSLYYLITEIICFPDRRILNFIGNISRTILTKKSIRIIQLELAVKIGTIISNGTLVPTFLTKFYDFEYFRFFCFFAFCIIFVN